MSSPTKPKLNPKRVDKVALEIDKDEKIINKSKIFGCTPLIEISSEKSSCSKIEIIKYFT